jgi:pimeloyl-ACP methyl ester carboxylesterase
MTIGAFADLMVELCDGLDLAQVDLIAHDTGGAIAQLFAARHPDRLRTLTLTNCDTQDNLPPEAFAPTVELARAGEVVPAAPGLLADPAAARSALFATGCENPELFSVEMVRAFIEPVLGTPAAAEKFQELIAGLDPADLAAAEPTLRQLNAPTLIVWGTGDDFFDVKWAYWLRDLIPGARPVVELPGARLFFPTSFATSAGSGTGTRPQHERGAAHLRDLSPRHPHRRRRGGARRLPPSRYCPSMIS